MIDITGCDLVTLVQEAYNLSAPHGLGWLHATPDPLTREDAQTYIHPDARIALSLDYVKGRSVKLVVFKTGDRLELRDVWYDHSANDLAELVRRIRAPAEPDRDAPDDRTGNR